MLIQLALLWAIGCMKGHSVGAIECYTCSNSSSLPSCTSLSHCPADSACSSEYTTVQGTRFYTLGCRTILSCPTVSSSSMPPIVGRREAGASTNCSECCHSNHCNRQLCQDTDGSWSSWSAWGQCTKTCGGGVKTRTRDCNNPAPSLTGQGCYGEATEADSCSVSSCQGPVEFFAKVLPGSGGISLSHGATLRFTTVVTNVGHGYDSSTGIFAAPVNGTYSFNVQFCTYYQHTAIVGLVVNGVPVTTMIAYGDGNHGCSTLTVPVILKQGDKVHASIELGSDIPLYQSSVRINSFSGILIQ